jgi:hypothetical protein
MILVSVLVMAAPIPSQTAGDIPVINPIAEAKSCPETPMSLARKMGRTSPRAIPLAELPPAQAFMAVDRRVDGCPAPLTMLDYRGR